MSEFYIHVRVRVLFHIMTGHSGGSYYHQEEVDIMIMTKLLRSLSQNKIDLRGGAASENPIFSPGARYNRGKH